MSKLIDMTGWLMSEHNVPDSRIKVLYRVENHQKHKTKWACQCMCGNDQIFIADGTNLRNGNTKSCGCIHKENLIFFNQQTKKLTNKYDLTGEYGIGWTYNTNEEFYFDLEDYDKIKDICWSKHKRNNTSYTRITGIDCKTNKIVSITQVICGEWMDHINRNTFDNRKCNLRRCSQRENTRNRSVPSNNKSGIIGVWWNKRDNTWEAGITVDKQKKYIGRFINKTDAIKARLQAEEKYFGEFAPQRHLFEQYDITIQN